MTIEGAHEEISTPCSVSCCGGMAGPNLGRSPSASATLSCEFWQTAETGGRNDPAEPDCGHRPRVCRHGCARRAHHLRVRRTADRAWQVTGATHVRCRRCRYSPRACHRYRDVLSRPCGDRSCPCRRLSIARPPWSPFPMCRSTLLPRSSGWPGGSASPLRSPDPGRRRMAWFRPGGRASVAGYQPLPDTRATRFDIVRPVDRATLRIERAVTRIDRLAAGATASTASTLAATPSGPVIAGEPEHTVVAWTRGDTWSKIDNLLQRLPISGARSFGHANPKLVAPSAGRKADANRQSVDIGDSAAFPARCRPGHPAVTDSARVIGRSANRSAGRPSKCLFDPARAGRPAISDPPRLLSGCSHSGPIAGPTIARAIPPAFCRRLGRNTRSSRTAL